jgi:hypothetical protein
MEEQKFLSKEMFQRQTAEGSESKAISAITHSVRQTYRPLRIGGWSVASVAVAIALLNKPLGGILEEIFAGNSAAAYSAKLALGVIATFGLILGFYAQQKEAKEIDRLKSIMTDAGIQYLLYRYDFSIFRREVDGNDNNFSLSTLADAVAEHTRIRDRSTCEATAEAILKKLVARGLVSPQEAKSLSPRYSIDKQVLEEIGHRVSWQFDQPSLIDIVRVRLKRFFRYKRTKKPDT